MSKGLIVMLLSYNKNCPGTLFELSKLFFWHQGTEYALLLAHKWLPEFWVQQVYDLGKNRDVKMYVDLLMSWITYTCLNLK